MRAPLPLRLALAISAVLSVPAGRAVAQAAQRDLGDSSRVVASASRHSRLTPDRAIVYALIEGSAETAPDAAQRAQTKLRAFEESLRRSGVAVQVEVPLPYGVSQAGNANGYPGMASPQPHVARYAIRLQPARIDQLLAVSAAAIAAGASYVSTPIFEATTADSVRRARLADAIAEARREAETMATALGGRLGTVIEVSCTDTATRGWPSDGFMQWSSRFEFGGGPAPTPEVLVSATATVRYRVVR